MVLSWRVYQKQKNLRLLYEKLYVKMLLFYLENVETCGKVGAEKHLEVLENIDADASEL